MRGQASRDNPTAELNGFKIDGARKLLRGKPDKVEQISLELELHARQDRQGPTPRRDGPTSGGEGLEEDIAFATEGAVVLAPQHGPELGRRRTETGQTRFVVAVRGCSAPRATGFGERDEPTSAAGAQTAIVTGDRKLIRNHDHAQLATAGTLDAAAVYPREVVKRALAHNAAAVIFSHNHPSGVAEPSQSDMQITRRLKDALGLIDERVIDHFIIGDGELVSLAERGLV